MRSFPSCRTESRSRSQGFDQLCRLVSDNFENTRNELTYHSRKSSEDPSIGREWSEVSFPPDTTCWSCLRSRRQSLTYQLSDRMRTELTKDLPVRKRPPNNMPEFLASPEIRAPALYISRFSLKLAQTGNVCVLGTHIRIMFPINMPYRRPSRSGRIEAPKKLQTVPTVYIPCQIQRRKLRCPVAKEYIRIRYWYRRQGSGQSNHEIDASNKQSS